MVLQKGYTALHCACRKGNEDAIVALLDGMDLTTILFAQVRFLQHSIHFLHSLRVGLTCSFSMVQLL